MSKQLVHYMFVNFLKKIKHWILSSRLIEMLIQSWVTHQSYISESHVTYSKMFDVDNWMKIDQHCNDLNTQTAIIPRSLIVQQG